MASIRKNRSGNWECRIRRRGYPPQTATFDIKTQARNWANTIESDMGRGLWVDQREAETTTLREALERYLLEVTPHKKSAYPEKRNARVILASDIASMTLATLRSKHVSEFVQEQERRGIGANSIRIYLSLLSHLFTVARRDWGMEALANPVEFARRPRLPGGRERRLLNGEEQSLLDAAPADLRDAIVLALETGLRRGELARLRWENIDLSAATAKIPETKTGVPRTIPLSTRAIATLAQRRDRGAQNERVFRWRDYDSITHAFVDLCRKLKIEGLRWHDLRHEATSRLFERGLGLQEVAAITGHKTWAMLKRYTHPRAEDLARKLSDQPKREKQDEHRERS
ncbi:MAG: site-specific integrase [Candidatus Binataceae bacterium]